MPTHTGSKNRSGPTKHTRGKNKKVKDRFSKNQTKKSILVILAQVQDF